jgi:hypothetical protein
MDFIKDFLSANWDAFLSHLKALGIPEEECEDYANKLLSKLEKIE